MLLAIAAVSALAFAALPAIASATTPTVDFTNAKFKGTFGTSSLKTATSTITCGTTAEKPNHVTGEFEGVSPSKTGKITLTFTGCKNGSINCQSGATTGEINVGPLPFHVVYITEDVKGGEMFVKTPGVLITPKEGGDFATFKCSLITITVTGNGVLGHLEKPECEKGASKTFALSFEEDAEKAEQTYQKTTTEGPFDLKADIGTSTETASQVGTAEAEFEGGGTGELTCP